MRAKLVAIAALVLTALGVTPVLAEGQVEVFLTVKTPEPTAKDKDNAPQIEATIVGGPTVPVEKFTLEKGEDQLTNYQFHRHHIDHVFCKVCGIKSFARGVSPKGERMIAVNVRCLDDVDVFTQPTQQFDGKKL